MFKPILYKLLGLVFATVVGIMVIIRAIFVGWKRTFGYKDRPLPPATLNDPKWGTHHYAQLPGLKMHYVEKGDRSKPLMIFLHGFPEFWFSWRFQMVHFAKDYWCVAVDNRGYGNTEKPRGIKNYSVDILATDIANLAKFLGREKFVLVGHDWGGAVGYGVCQLFPEMVECYITCNMPHPQSFEKQFNSNWRQMLKSWYMIYFQCPLLPELMIPLGDFFLLDQMFGELREDRRPDKETVECYKYNFNGRGATTGPLNYYRCAVQYGKIGIPSTKKTATPILQIWGKGDSYLDLTTATGGNKFCEDMEEKYYDGVSHWIMFEIPDEVNKTMEEYLERRNIRKRLS